MSYTPKLDWTSANGVSNADFIRIEQGIVDALPATSYTAADVLTKIKTVDGAGSGLDADTVKGYVPVNKAGDTLMSGDFLTTGWFGAKHAIDNKRVSVDFEDSTGQGAIVCYDYVGSAYLPTVLHTSSLQTSTNGINRFTVWDSQTLRLNAGALEYLDAGTWKVASGVKNVQRGTAAGPNSGASDIFNITISAVNLNKSFLTFSATNPSGGTSVGVKVRLTSTTNIEVSTGATGGNGAIVAYEVVESY